VKPLEISQLLVTFTMAVLASMTLHWHKNRF